MVNDPTHESPGRYAGLSRRGFLGAVGVAGSAAALGIAGAGAAQASTGRLAGARGLAQPAAQGIKGDVGATVTDAVYSQPNRLAAAELFDSYVSPAKGALVTQKFYFQESQWPTTPLENDITVMYDTAQGGNAKFRWIMCFKPSRAQVDTAPVPTPDQLALQAACNELTATGVIFDVVLWQEPNGQKPTGQEPDFPSGAAYQEYVAWYQPYVPAGIQVIYDCSGSATQADQTSYFPGRDLVQKVYMDFYGNTYAAALAAGDDDPLATINNLATSAGLPFGLGEWGFGLSASNALTPYTATPASQYVDYFIGVFTGRLSAGERNGAVVYYDGTNPSSTWNIITGPADWKTALYQQVYNDLASPNG